MTQYYLSGLLGLALAFACGDNNIDGDDTSSSGSDAATGMMTSSPSGATRGGVGTTTSADGVVETGDDATDDADASTGGPVAEPSVQWVGRFDASDPTRTRLSWSGSGFVVRFDGTGVGVRLDDAGRYFTLVVDGIVQPNLATSPGEQDYVLAGLCPIT